MKIIRPPLFMRPTPESELEQVIDRELRRLPDLRAPVDLLPRILQATAARARRPWWQKPASQWPVAGRCLFLGLATGIAGLFFYFTWGLGAGLSMGALSDEVAQYSNRFEVVRSALGSLGNALLVVARSAGPWLPWTAAGIVAISYVTTLGLGTCCYRLVASRD